MGLNHYRDEAGKFIENIGVTNEPIRRLLEMLEKEMAGLRISEENPDRFRHQVYDMLFLLFEIASKYGMDLDMEWEKGRQKKKEKYPQISSTNNITRYHKLIRDKIPEICLKDGKEPITRELTQAELGDFLALKLKEESNEFFESREIEELADLLEVIATLAKLNNEEMTYIEEIRLKKREERGGFDKGLLLIETRKRE